MSIELEQSPQFDPGDFRYAAAALIRYLIRAREKAEPGSMRQYYAEWGLDHIPNDNRSSEQLLARALQQIREIDQKFLGCRDSGGIQFDTNDPLSELKAQIGFFVDQFHDLPNAIRRLNRGEQVDWENLAAWQELSIIRQSLNQLPQPHRQKVYVTLQQAAAMIPRSKRTLENYKDKMPEPESIGGHGKPAEWDWNVLRPWLEKEFKRPLPERFPASQFQS